MTWHQDRNFMMRADAIVGYVFDTEFFCPLHILGGIGVRDAGSTNDVESRLDQLASARGIDRGRESSFGTDDFPQVMLVVETSDERCATCHELLIEV